MKICTGCKTEKPIGDFHRDKRRPNGRMARCKDCKRQALNEWRRLTGHDAKRYRKNREAELERHLISKYGITMDKYDAMFADQCGRCAICRAAHNGKRRFDVDHDHDSGEVRGLLCTSCNRMLGHARDSIITLRRAIAYLQSSRKSQRRS